MTKLSARLVALTTPTIALREANAEGLIAFCARVSNPKQQDKELGTLLDYCIRNKHWSIFQICNAVVEIEAPRDITRQFTRHSSLYCYDPFEAPGFNYDYGGVQEFSQRYSDEISFTTREFRRQDARNRQNSIDNLDSITKEMASGFVEDEVANAQHVYNWLREKDVAKECARVILPEGLTMSRLYVNGNLRSWLTYLSVRDDPGVTQHEHVMLAREIKKCLEPAFPTVFKSLSKDEKQS
jgi:thymidylate synthase (FAD)